MLSVSMADHTTKKKNHKSTGKLSQNNPPPPAPNDVNSTHAFSPSSPCSSPAPCAGVPSLAPCPCPAPSRGTGTSLDPQPLAQVTLTGTSCPCPTLAQVAPLASSQAPLLMPACPWWRREAGRVLVWREQVGGGGAGGLLPPPPDGDPSAS